MSQMNGFQFITNKKMGLIVFVSFLCWSSVSSNSSGGDSSSGGDDSGPYTRHKWVGRMICSQAIVSAHAQDLLRLPESMTIIKNTTDNLRFSFPLMSI
jgi:hypothetical protein